MLHRVTSSITASGQRSWPGGRGRKELRRGKKRGPANALSPIPSDSRLRSIESIGKPPFEGGGVREKSPDEAGPYRIASYLDARSRPTRRGGGIGREEKKVPEKRGRGRTKRRMSDEQLPSFKICPRQGLLFPFPAEGKKEKKGGGEPSGKGEG